MFKILVINLGSTSSKIAYYEDITCIWKDNIVHTPEELQNFHEILDQFDYRKKVIIEYIKKKGIDYKKLNAIVSRGGHTKAIEGGTYSITPEMLCQIKSGKYGRHACDIGVLIADSLTASSGALAAVVDPPVTDEFEPISYYSGLPEMPRRSSFHALNQRAVAKQYAKDNGKIYEKTNFIVAHMGGGISVASHKKGKMIDANNALAGDGPFSTNRTGTLPVGDLIKMCYSDKFSKEEMLRKVNGQGGMMAYLGENDAKKIEELALSGDEKYKLCFDAMLYQTCKEIGAAATVLKGEVEAIILTGGIGHSNYVVSYIKDSVGFIAPISVYAGEYEMQALALGAYDALNKTANIKEIERITG